MTIRKVIDFCNERFHPEYQEDYDNAGFLLGNADAECTGVLTAIDLTPQVVEEAIRYGLNLIVTHHPFIFGGIKRITTDSDTGRMVYKLIGSNLAVYAAHTNLDNMIDGVNGILADKLGLTETVILRPSASDSNVGSGLVGRLSNPLSFDEFCQMVKRTLSLPMLRTSVLFPSKVERVAICGGSGSFLIGDARAACADVFLTADLKYHDFQKADQRLALLDAGHYESEQFAKELIYSVISQKFSTFACRISDSANSYIRYM